MIKYLLCFFLTVATVRISWAQAGRDTLLMVPGKDGAYFYHVVDAKETIYSLSRTYGLEPKVLAGFNGLTLKTPLKIYQLLKIPLTSADLDQVSATPPSGAVPLYHKVTRGETLYHISKLQGSVPVTLLKRWNALKTNAVNTGEMLVVGWLKKGGSAAAVPQAPPAGPAEDHPSPAAETVAAPPEARAKAAVASRPAAAQSSAAADDAGDGFLGEVIASENARHSRHASGTPAAGPSRSFAGEDAFSVAPPHSTAPKKAAVPAAKAPVKTDAAGESPARLPVATQPEVSVETATAAPAPSTQKLPSPPAPSKPDSFEVLLNRVTTAKATAATPSRPAAGSAPVSASAAATAAQPAASADAGAQAPPLQPTAESPATVKSEFQAQFDQQTANGARLEVKKGAAGWFKSNVKAGSGRYYALCNDLPRGTIVRVVNPINQRSVLVKVLDVIPNQKDNYNLIIKLSDAAKGDLDVTQSRFWCEINYPGQGK